jgi:protein SCO1
MKSNYIKFNIQYSTFNISIGLLSIAVCILFSCGSKEKDLPIFGERDVIGNDTIYHTIAKFQFADQDSAVVNNETFQGKIYVADFFFTSCRTICPIMKTQMMRVYEATQEMPDVLLLSHTIDPELIRLLYFMILQNDWT